MRYEQFISKWAEEYEKNGISYGENLPDMDLYMDQMVSVLNDELAIYADENGAPLTKSIVSNYTKHHMIPGPDGKRYTKAHMMFTLMVFYLKGGFSMDQIERLMKPTLANYDSQWDDQVDLQGMYREIVSFVKTSEEGFADAVEKRVQDVKKFLAERDQDDDISEITMLILSMIMRSNAERFLAEKLLDEYFPDPKKKSAKKKK